MEKRELKKLIDTAAGRIPADLVVRNGKIADVFSGDFVEGDLAVSGGLVAGIGRYEGETVVDTGGQYVLPGFIDGHIHIESSYLCPEELGRLLVPHGTAAIIADPHEIVNVCGLEGLDYMRSAAAASALEVYFMVPSCVPATPFEHAGAELDAAVLSVPMDAEGVLGLGELMNYPGVVNGDGPVLDKILLAHRKGKLIDGHSPGLGGMPLNAYAAARIYTKNILRQSENSFR